MSWAEVDPLPTQFWVRWAPRRPPAAEAPYVDFGARRLVWEQGEGAERALPDALPGDVEVTLLSPAPDRLAGEIARLAEGLLERGAPIVLQQIAGGPVEWLRPDSVEVHLLDLTALLLAGVGGRERLAAIPRPAGTVWVLFPLLPGVAAAAEELDAWLEEVARLDPAAVVGVTPELEPSDRRRLVERVAEERFGMVFHGRARGEAELARAASAFGLPVLPQRPPLAGLSPRAQRNRELATVLAECGDLQIRLGESEVEGAALLAAARHIERSSYDVAALAREGNLELLEWLSTGARRLVESEVRGETDPSIAALRGLWRGPVA